MGKLTEEYRMLINVTMVFRKILNQDYLENQILQNINKACSNICYKTWSFIEGQYFIFKNFSEDNIEKYLQINAKQKRGGTR